MQKSSRILSNTSKLLKMRIGISRLVNFLLSWLNGAFFPALTKIKNVNMKHLSSLTTKLKETTRLQHSMQRP